MLRLPFLIWVMALPLAAAAQSEDFTSLKGHGGPIMGLDTDAEGTVASASFDNSVGVWRREKPIWLEAHEAAVVDVVFTFDGDIVSGGDDFAVRLWRDGQETLLGRHKGKVTDLEVSPDGAFVASASWDGTIALWSLTGQADRRFDQHDAGFSDVAFSPDGKKVYAATSAGEVLVYQAASDPVPRVLVRHGFGINEIVIGPDETWLAYGAVDGVTRVIAPETGEELRDFSLDRRPILAMSYHAASNQLAVGDGHGYIMMIDTARWRITRDFRAMRQGPVWALAFDPSGRFVYAGGLDDVIYRWPVALLDSFDPIETPERSFLRDSAEMANGERQFMRKCSICHTLEAGASRKAGPSLHALFGRVAGTLPEYRYSETLLRSQIVWTEKTIDALFDQGPDNFIPNSKMPMQVIAAQQDRDDLITFLRQHSP